MIENGEEHGLEVSVLDSIRPAEVELWTKIVAIGEYEDVDEDEDIESGFGAFLGAEATHNDGRSINCERTALQQSPLLIAAQRTLGT